ncbi:MAG: protein tyrosine phosphatase [Desulfofustis sp.]|nr:protein tyrosine phosphatase [Desulfofustis sp.]
MTCHLADFIDMHCHILPSVDDGPADLAQSTTLARMYTQVGVTAVVATPHFLPGTSWATSASTVLRMVDELQHLLNQKSIPLRILPGMEIAFHRKLEQRLKAGELLPLADSSYYLIEPSFQGDQGECVTLLGTLQQDGFHFILAHPERIEGFQNSPHLLRQLAEQGILLQINTGSLLGKFGATSQRIANELKEQGHLHFLASDAHDVTRRGPLTAADWQQIEDLLGGPELLHRCCQNSTRLIAATGNQAPYDPSFFRN